MKTVKTAKIVKCLVSLFAAVALLLLAGGAKQMFSSESSDAEAAKIKAAALLYVPAAEKEEIILNLAEHSPEFLLFTASSANLQLVDDSILE